MTFEMKEPYRDYINILPINKILTVEDIKKIQKDLRNEKQVFKSLDNIFLIFFWQINQFLKNW
jgi:hypothetical protein